MASGALIDMSKLQQLDYLPEEILTTAPETLYQILPEPTLIHLQGQQPDPLFVSVLLHGNEPTGFLALQQLLQKFKKQTLPRSLSVFLGNIHAARFGLRRLENQPDFNRIWPGTEIPPCKETLLMQEVFDVMKAREPFASLDIHNNTGLNPHYACINKLDNQFIQLASLFGRLVVYFIHPKGVQSAAFANLCPSVTLECGRPGQKHGVEHAFEFLNSCLNLTALANHSIPVCDIDIYHTVAQIKVKENISFSFDSEKCDLLLDKDLERMNFTEIAAGTMLGTVNHCDEFPVVALNETGKIITDDFFVLNNNELQLKRRTMPSMLTLDEQVIKQDCLCYLMEKMKL